MSGTQKRTKPEAKAPRASTRDASRHSSILVWNGLVARARAREPRRSERDPRDQAQTTVCRVDLGVPGAPMSRSKRGEPQ